MRSLSQLGILYSLATAPLVGQKQCGQQIREEGDSAIDSRECKDRGAAYSEGLVENSFNSSALLANNCFKREILAVPIGVLVSHFDSTILELSVKLKYKNLLRKRLHT